MRLALFAALESLASAGCLAAGAPAPPSKPAVVFPSRDELARIPSQGRLHE
jgi:hypothetical protein